jgi:hypothetical protein
MKYKHRITLLFTFIIFFLITAPAVVLYTAGYRLNFDTGQLVRTGLFYVTSIPKNASISINDETTESTPGFVQNLIPRDYQVKLAKDGYHDWNKTLPIYSNETTFIEDITLFLNTKPSSLVQADIVKSAVSPDQVIMAYLISTESWLELWTYNIETEEQLLLNRYIDSPNENITFSWSTDGERLLIEHEQTTNTSYLVIDKNGNSRIEMSEATEETVEHAWWHPEDPLVVLFYSPTETFQYRISTGQVTEIYTGPTLATTDEGQAVLIQNVDNATSVFRSVNDHTTLLAYLPLGEYELLPASWPHLLLHEPDKERLILIDIQQDSQPILLDADASGATWATDGSGRLLYYNDFEVHIYDPTGHTDELLVRISEPTLSAAWHPEGNAVLACRSSGLYAIELDWRDQRNIYQLSNGADLSSLLITKNGQTAYFVGKVDPDRGLFELELQER